MELWQLWTPVETKRIWSYTAEDGPVVILKVANPEEIEKILSET